MQALVEAYRALRPGGIAIITTPAPGYARRIVAVRETLRCFRHAGQSAKKGDFRRMWQALLFCLDLSVDVLRSRTRTYLGSSHLLDPGRFWQYEYKPAVLVRFLKTTGFRIIWSGSTDLRYNEYRLGRWRINIQTDMNRLQRLDRLETSPLVHWGGFFAVTVAVKPGPRMHCFLCNELSVEEPIKTVPICRRCASSSLAGYYQHTRRPKIADRWLYNPPVSDSSVEQTCVHCEKRFRTNPLFEDAGFLDPTCDECLKNPEVNIRLSNERLKLVWRPRST